MKIVKNNLIPIFLALAVTTGIFFILSYISYDINSYKPEPVSLENMLKGRVEPDEFIDNVNVETLEEYYKAPVLINNEPEIYLELFKVNDTDLYNWLRLPPPASKK